MKLWLLLVATLQVSTVFGCFPTNERQVQFGAQTVQFQQPPPVPQEVRLHVNLMVVHVVGQMFHHLMINLIGTSVMDR
ncbi:hypothetical protein NECAME_08809 [Necator americanus]|uniref:Secreted protein n=1 Tax=Necator americanus TaxID=51031 RepID=W2TJ04_NECAM|nr:hypothetical protein NECAME_08809 [Necator americanus]ETN81007.1 hypothetical protein NECAME_08809 [Necator americanus]